MLRSIHRDEHRQHEIFVGLGDRDGALRREDFVVRFDMHDVFVFGYRPVGSLQRVLAVVHGRLGPQPIKVVPELVLLPQVNLADINVC